MPREIVAPLELFVLACKSSEPMGKRGNDSVETLRIKLAEAEAKRSAKRLKKQTGKSGAKATRKPKDSNELAQLGSGDDDTSTRDPLADDNDAPLGNRGKRAILVK